MVLPSLPADGDGIRLFYLLPGEPDSLIKAGLKAVKISASPPYECISYMWGSPGTAKHIYVNGNLTPLRRNLWTFLQKLRSPVDTRIVWVDALCISQDDAVEKMQQVQMIGRIFRRATRILAWVSEYQDDDSHKIFSHARRYSYGWAETQHLEKQGLKLDVIGLKDQLLRFSKREYWSRTWIVQEIVLARLGILHCGNDQCDLDTFLILVYSLARTEDGSRGLSPHLRRLAMERSRGLSKNIDPDRIDHDSTPERRLDFLLRNFADTRCFIARDRIFALLSIEEKTPEDQEIIPDYTIDDLTLCIRVWRSRQVSYEGRYGTGSKQLLELIVDALGMHREFVDIVYAADESSSESSWQRAHVDDDPVQTTTSTNTSTTRNAPQTQFPTVPFSIVIGIVILVSIADYFISSSQPAKTESPQNMASKPQVKEFYSLSPALPNASETQPIPMALSAWLTWTFSIMLLTTGFRTIILPRIVIRRIIMRPFDPEKRKSDLIRSFYTSTRTATFSAVVVVAFSSASFATLFYYLVTAVYSRGEARRISRQVYRSLDESPRKRGPLAIMIAHGVVVAYICSLNYVFHLAADLLHAYIAERKKGNYIAEDAVIDIVFAVILGVMLVGYCWRIVCGKAHDLVVVVFILAHSSSSEPPMSEQKTATHTYRREAAKSPSTPARLLPHTLYPSSSSITHHQSVPQGP